MKKIPARIVLASLVALSIGAGFSVGTKPRLIPYNVQPDGTPGQYRIQEGMTWSLTNTLSF